MTLHILTICTGNICRSPLAALLLATKLGAPNFAIDTAGTSPVVGEPIQDTMQRIAERMGANDVLDHRATGLTRHAVDNADLILGMDRDHRRAAAKLVPNAARRSFTLLEFAHVVSYVDDVVLETHVQTHGEPVKDALEMVMRMRGVVPRLSSDRLYDVPDPFGRSKQVYERSAKQIERAVDQIVGFLNRTQASGTALTGFNETLMTPESE